MCKKPVTCIEMSGPSSSKCLQINVLLFKLSKSFDTN